MDSNKVLFVYYYSTVVIIMLYVNICLHVDNRFT